MPSVQMRKKRIRKGKIINWVLEKYYCKDDARKRRVTKYIANYSVSEKHVNVLEMSPIV